jgi:hypothetical protein
MKLTEDAAFTERILDGVLDKMLGKYDKRKRWQKDEDPHLSELLYCLTSSYWQGRDDQGTITHSSKTRLRFAIGVALEEIMLRPVGDSETGTFEGVQYEMDAVTEDDHLVEFKSTRMGVKRFTTDFPIGYYRQLLGYMKIHGVVKAKFTVMFIIPPELITWEVEVTQEAVDTNWVWVQNRRYDRERFMEDGTIPPPFTTNEKYECKDCAFKLLCDIEAAREGR